MPLKSVIDVDVDDSRFRAFMELFQRYQAALARMPQDWGKLNVGVAGTADQFGMMTSALLAQADLIHRIDKEQQNLNRTASTTRSAMRGVAQETASIARAVSDTTRNLLRWTGVAGLFGGLLGAGSLFGLDRAAQAGTALQNRSLSLGVSPTRLLALRNSFGSFDGGLDTSLTNIQRLQQTPTASFNILGIDSNGSPDEVYVRGLKRIRELARADHSGNMQSQPWYQTAAGMYSNEMIQTSMNMSDSQFNKQLSQRDKYNTSGYGLNPGTLDAGREMEQTLGQTADILKYSFLAGLQKAIPNLNELSVQLGNTVKAFLEGDGFASLVTLGSKGLKTISDYLNDPQFKEDLKNFEDGLKGVGGALKWMTAWIKSFPGTAGSLFLNAIPGGSLLADPSTGIGVGGIGPNPRINRIINGVTGAYGSVKNWFGVGGASGATLGSLPQGALEAISKSEGTFDASGINYNKVYGGGTAPLTGMTLAQVAAYQGGMSGPTPVGGFQINRATLGDAVAGAGLSWNDKFDAGNQAKLASWLHSKRGTTPWAGFGAHPDQLKAFQDSMGAAGGTTGAADSAGRFLGMGAADPAVRSFVKSATNLDPTQAAWCAAFANAALASKGIKGSGSNLATDFEKWGVGINPGGVQKDDIVVLPRGLGPGQAGGHVGVATGERWGNTIGMISGNHGGRVGLSWEDPDKVMVRRAPEAGPGSVNIKVENVTGGNAAISSSQNVGTY